MPVRRAVLSAAKPCLHCLAGSSPAESEDDPSSVYAARVADDYQDVRLRKGESALPRHPTQARLLAGANDDRSASVSPAFYYFLLLLFIYLFSLNVITGIQKKPHSPLGLICEAQMCI
jgi:hypothetical protein